MRKIQNYDKSRVHVHWKKRTPDIDNTHFVVEVTFPDRPKISLDTAYTTRHDISNIFFSCRQNTFFTTSDSYIHICNQETYNNRVFQPLKVILEIRFAIRIYRTHKKQIGKN